MIEIKGLHKLTLEPGEKILAQLVGPASISSRRAIVTELATALGITVDRIAIIPHDIQLGVFKKVV